MPACPECQFEPKEIRFAFDSARHRIRTWCPYCRVWWSVKYRADDHASQETPNHNGTLKDDGIETAVSARRY